MKTEDVLKMVVTAKAMIHDRKYNLAISILDLTATKLTVDIINKGKIICPRCQKKSKAYICQPCYRDLLKQIEKLKAEDF
jgi:2-hydroxy-3-keto-5-methylthiopentenyl-1-phosphate phosphatase